MSAPPSTRCSVELGPDPGARRRDRGAAAAGVRRRDGRSARRARPRGGADAAPVDGSVRGRGRIHGADARLARRRGPGVLAQVAVRNAGESGARARLPPGDRDAVRRRDRGAEGDPGCVRGDRDPNRGGERGSDPRALARRRQGARDPGRGRAGKGASGCTAARAPVRGGSGVRAQPLACGRGRRRPGDGRLVGRGGDPRRRCRGSGHKLSRAGGAARLARARHARQRGRREHPECARAGHADRGGMRVVLRQPRVAA